MKYQCLLHTKDRRFCHARPMDAILSRWGSGEAEKIDGKWEGIRGYEIVETADLSAATEDYVVIIQASWGNMEVKASEIDYMLVPNIDLILRQFAQLDQAKKVSILKGSAEMAAAITDIAEDRA